MSTFVPTIQRIPAQAALAGDPKAAADIEARFTEISSLRAHTVQLAQALRDAALMELGTKYEAEKNKTLWRRIKTALIGTFGLSGLIALCIFCPAVIPIITRALAWLVAKIPQLAGALGVVGKDAFDAVVKAVGTPAINSNPQALIFSTPSIQISAPRQTNPIKS